MQIILPKPMSGMDILNAFDMALGLENKSGTRHNRKWEVRRFETRAECIFHETERTLIVGRVGIVAHLKEAHLDSWHDVLPTKVGHITISPLNPLDRYIEVGIEIGTISENEEMFILNSIPEAYSVMSALMERFRSNLYNASLRVVA